MAPNTIVSDAIASSANEATRSTDPLSLSSLKVTLAPLAAPDFS